MAQPLTMRLVGVVGGCRAKQRERHPARALLAAWRPSWVVLAW